MTRAEIFDRLHDSSADPWQVETSWYEIRKRAVTLAALPRRIYSLGFEPGCSIGMLSEALASRCDALVVVDASAVAVDRARGRLARFPHVTVSRLEVPSEWPKLEPDLLVLSEVAYFLSSDELDSVVEHAWKTVPVGGDVVLVNWKGRIDGFSGLDAGRIHGRFRTARGFRVVVSHDEPEFLLEVFRR